MADTNVDLQDIHDVLLDIAMKAGEMILSADPSSGSKGKKNTADPVTETDQAVEKMINETLRSRYPSHVFMGEETYDYKNGTPLTDDPTFILDPIDGTTNFIHGYPFVCVSLGFCLNKRPVVGIVYNPLTSLLWSAIRGQGAFVRSMKPTSIAGISTTPRRLPLKQTLPPLTGLSSCVVAVEWGSDRDGTNWDARVDFFSKLGGSKKMGGGMAHGIRSSGSAALNFCSVASGEIDAAWEAGAWAWDVAAAWVILEEAGGRLVSLDPRPNASTWEERAPPLDGRKYFAIRAAADEDQKGVAEELWGLGEVERFKY